MNLLSWNYRGLKSPRAIQIFENLISQHNPYILFFYGNKAHDL